MQTTMSVNEAKANFSGDRRERIDSATLGPTPDTDIKSLKADKCTIQMLLSLLLL